MMLNFVGILFVLVIVALLVGGVLLIKGSWQPFKDEEGNPIPFTEKEKWSVGAFVAAAVIGVCTLFLATDHPWVKKMKGRRV
ncbi:hypothetical protein HN858_02140 [Candidatus Falkowbacteria bacterium]|nr:hypothetical protein [Candidatus Falkowbacteria bacterium]MBT5502816.1 hypothetical protein [Candidatus Falkowbacteria bacterium]MBT6573413.1 hypothetical protein [Candidatus Falkowbacteria bacterium]MBT7348455.1 hypothetical protein [Candidatus Falkowbacteria bacterium]MBT7501201.1 hypothetical protein [Candidatus Falkowbacteria bacterium]